MSGVSGSVLRLVKGTADRAESLAELAFHKESVTRQRVEELERQSALFAQFVSMGFLRRFRWLALGR